MVVGSAIIRCHSCGADSQIDVSAVVACAQIATFYAAHNHAGSTRITLDITDLQGRTGRPRRLARMNRRSS